MTQPDPQPAGSPEPRGGGTPPPDAEPVMPPTPDRPGLRRGTDAAARIAGIDKLTTDHSDGSLTGDVADVANKVRQGATLGAKVGGGAGSVVGAIAGVASAAVHNRRVRNLIIGGVIASLIATVGPIIAITWTVVTAVTQATQTNSATAAVNSGWDTSQVASLAEAGEGTNAPWQVLAAVEWVTAGGSAEIDTDNPFGIDLDALNKRLDELNNGELTEADLARVPIAGRALSAVLADELVAAQKLNTDMDLTAGSLNGLRSDGSQGLYVPADDPDLQARYESMHTTFVTAIGNLPVTAARQPEEVFTAAHTLALGDPLTAGCGANPGIVTAADGTWVQPTIDADGKIGSGFGMRMHPILHILRLHAGDDLGNKAGTPIFAASSGTVVYVGENSGAGWMIKIDHGNGIATQYLHMEARADILVSTGDHVRTGQHIARMGSGGLSTAPHLHFEVIVNGTKVDPAKFYTARGLTITDTPTVTGTGDDVWASPPGATTTPGKPTTALLSAGTATIVGSSTFRNSEGTPIKFTKAMTQNAVTIATAIASLQTSETLTEADRERLFVMAVMTGIQESWMGTAKNTNAGTDVGIFQERSKVGWYADEATQQANVAKLQDVAYQTANLINGHDVAIAASGAAGPVGYHIPGLLDQDNWRTDEMWKVIADTQRPAAAFRQQYAKWQPVGEALLASFQGLLTGSSSTGCTGTATQLTVTQANIVFSETGQQFAADLALAADGADIITLNEVRANRVDDLRTFAAAHGYQLVHNVPGAAAVLVKDTVGTETDAGVVKASDGALDIADRMIVWMTVTTAGGELTIASTHALPGIEHGGKPKGSASKLALAEQHFRAVAAFAADKASQGSVLIGGDMNVDYVHDRETGYPGFPWTVLEDKGQGTGLRSIYTASGVQAGHTTKHSKARKIDYLYSGAADAKLTNSGYTIVESRYSDHNFVKASYSLAGADDEGDGTWADIITMAKSMVGVYPYVWGGGTWDGPTGGGFDCSGFVLYLLAQGTGGKLKLPHHAATMAAWLDSKGAVIRTNNIDDVHAGDLVFYASGSSTDSIYHVALAIGDGKIVEEPGTGRKVQINKLSARMPGDLWGVARFNPDTLTSS